MRNTSVPSAQGQDLPHHPPHHRNVLFALLGWVAALNLPFFILEFFFSFDRGNFILLYIALFLVFVLLTRTGLMTRHPVLSRVLVYGLVFGTICFELFRFSYYFFGLRGPEMLQALPMITHLDPTSYPMYFGFGVGMTVCFAAFIFLSGQAVITRKRDVIAVCIPLAALAIADVIYNQTLHFKADLAFGLDSVEMSSPQPFERAVNQDALLEPRLINGEDRDLLVVVVEALGVFKNQTMNTQLFTAFENKELNQNFDIKRGTISYKGSTTASEMRELCGSRDSYLEVLYDEFDPSNCLPNVLAENGYSTVAYHGFHGELFERENWYKKIGFANSRFLKDLFQENEKFRKTGFCGSTFKGACDKQIADLVHHDFVSGETKRFAYWLTLNSHFPAKRRANFGTPFECSQFGLDYDNQICVMSEYWTEVFEQVRTIAMADRPRPIDIVLVGDHAPPLLWRTDRDRFQPGYVPYVILKEKQREMMAYKPEAVETHKR